MDETPSTWTLGGGSNPAADDGIDYDPNIIDMILNGSGQEQMLASYDVDNHVYAKLTGFEMPEVPQQIFGASIEAVTNFFCSNYVVNDRFRCDIDSICTCWSTAC